MTIWASVRCGLRPAGRFSASRPLIAGMVCLATVFSAPPLEAGWFGKKPQPSASANPNQGYAGTIRRLQKEAQAAANRGDLATARTLAERAHKLSITCRAMLVNDPDCSPEATADLVRRLTGSSPPPHVPAPKQSPAVVQAVDLTPLLDTSSTPVPPSPPPTPVTPPLPETSLPPKPHTNPTPNRLREAIGESPKPENPPIGLKASSPSLPSRAAKAPTESLPDSSPFLVMRSDWLGNSRRKSLTAPPPRHPIKPIPDHSAELQENQPKNRDPVDEDQEDAEVTTAIGRSSDVRWELDADEEDASWDSSPQLPIDRLPAETMSPSPEATPSGRLIETIRQGASTPSRKVLTLSEFLDPQGADSQLSSQVVETRFDTSPESGSSLSQTFSEKVQESSGAISTEGAARLQRPRRQPAVSVREDPALDWLPVSDAQHLRSPTETDAARFSLAWLQKGSNQAVVGGVFLIVCGAVLFAVSLRRS